MTTLLSPGNDFGPYRIESRLGSGGMGVVFLATDQRLGRRVALKVVSGALADDPGFQARFQHEAATLARVDSPHIVSIFEHGQHAGAAYIATQYVPGGDLGSLLTARGPLPPDRALVVAEQLAQALEAAHRAGIVHRDVKPANVLVRDPDALPLFVHLCDFGIAQTDQSGQTATGAVAGSWSYLPPERLNGERATPASDIYALGCVLWAALTARAPYTGSDLQVAQAHLSAPIPQLPGDDPETRRINAVLSRCLAKDPADRFPSAGALRQALLDSGAEPTGFAPAPFVNQQVAPGGHLSRGGTLPGPTDDFQAPGGRAPRGGRIAAAAVAAVAVVALVATVLVWTLRDTGAPAAQEPGGEVSGGEVSGQISESPEELEPDPDLDRAAVLREIATEAFPNTEVSDPTALSWSVDPSNLTGGLPRQLLPHERDSATTWQIRARQGEHTYTIGVEHIAPDSPTTPDCTGLTSNLVECVEFTTTDGRAAIEYWFKLPELDWLSHQVVIFPRPGTDLPSIRAGEQVAGLGIGPEKPEMRSALTMTRNALAEIAIRRELQFPPPEQTPELPSHGYCVSEPGTTLPGCPEGLS